MSKYNDFCYIKLILHYLFNSIEELLSVNRIVYLTYQEVFIACCQGYSYLEDYYTKLEVDLDKIQINNNKDLNIELELEANTPLADFKAYVQQRPDNQGQLDRLSGFRTCYIDQEYNWSLHIGKYNISSEGWTLLQAENPIKQAVDVDLSARSLNLEQRKLYNIVVDQYTQELSYSGLPPPLLLNVDRVARSRKTYTFFKIYTKLQNLAS